jgi:LacI family transcriptional regulator
VATKAGVAPSTVSLVLNRTPGPRIPEETRKRVVDAARELGYQSSTIARALVTGKTSTVGVVMHFVDRPFHSYVAGVLDGFWDTLHRHGYRMLMASGSAEACVSGLYRERSVDGILLFAAPYLADDGELRNMVDAGFPAVFVGTLPKGAKADYVDVDNVDLGEQATRLLLASGHRDILHLAGPLEVNSAAIDRRTGYLRALQEAGIPAREELIVDCSFNGTFVEERLGAAMARGARFTAIFAANHAMAQGAVQALRKRGLQVPRDVSITAIDADSRADPGSELVITSFAQPLEELGREAGRLLFERIGGAARGAKRVHLPCRKIAGSSIARPPR